MQPALALACMPHGCEQHGMREEFAILDHQVDARDVHMHDAPGANVEMADFAMAHLPLGQADEGPAGVNESVGILAQQPIVNRLARESDGVGFRFGAVSPAVEDDENEWFRTRHKCSFQLLASSSSLKLCDYQMTSIRIPLKYRIGSDQRKFFLVALQIDDLPAAGHASRCDLRVAGSRNGRRLRIR